MKPLYPLLLLASTLAQGAELRLLENASVVDQPALWLGQTLGVTLRSDYDKASLTGHHYHFQQTWEGVPIATRFAALSLDGDGRPWRYYHHTRPVTAAPAACRDPAPLADYVAAQQASETIARFAADAAQAQAWYWPTAEGLVPAWRLLAVEHKRDTLKSTAWQIFLSCDGQSELGRLTQNAATRDQAQPLAGNAETVSTQVFEQDPRTRLAHPELVWRAELTLPAEAYSRVSLPVTRMDDGWHLAGPYARVVDATAPDTAPFIGEHADAFMLAHSHPAFLDINAYYHLDLAQRHVARLGFADLMGGALNIDTDAGWQDNSLYDPYERRLEIGRSGVPDAEDPMVIWHEFGHAVQHHILPDLGDAGDWGAIGEGFSDYLAASWRQRSPQGQGFEPFMVFNWDARFSGRTPRQLDDGRARYHPDMRYPAHVTVNGSNADQLWGTPLFTALREAVERHGEPARDEMDRLLIESHFGLGPDIRMPQLARVTVETARRLYPERDYALLLEQAFRHHGILQAPLTVRPADGSYLQPGEPRALILELVNDGADEVRVIQAQAHPQNGLTPTGNWQGSVAGHSQTRWPLTVTADAKLQCGRPVELPLSLTLDGVAPSERNARLTLSLPVGKPVLAHASGNGGPLKEATSSEEHGLTRYRLTLDAGTARVDEGFILGMDLEHERLEELQIWLTSPYGTRIVLWDRAHSSGTRLHGAFPITLQPLEPLDALLGEPLSGTWQLDIVDAEPGHGGALHDWYLQQQVGAECGKKEELPTTGVIPLGDDSEGGGGALGWPLLTLLLLVRRLRARH